MNTASQSYKTAGLQRILTYKQAFGPGIESGEPDVNRFVNLFCEYQLADNNYMNLHLEQSFNTDDVPWFNSLTMDQVLQLITYIIWTDRFSPGYLHTKIKDKTLFRLLDRLEMVHLHTGGDPVTP